MNTPFVKARYVGDPKRIGRFGLLDFGCIATLTRNEWNTLIREGNKNWEHVEDTMVNDEVIHPSAANDADSIEEEYDETKTQDEVQEEEQDDDEQGGSEAVEQREGTGDQESKVVRTHNEDGTFKEDDPETPENEAFEEVVPYESCTIEELREEITRRNEEEGKSITPTPRARKKTLIKLLEADDAADE